MRDTARTLLILLTMLLVGGCAACHGRCPDDDDGRRPGERITITSRPT